MGHLSTRPQVTAELANKRESLEYDTVIVEMTCHGARYHSDSMLRNAPPPLVACCR